MIKPAVKKPRPKFIDRLEKELKSAGVIIKRGGMTDWAYDKKGKRMDDPCEWIKIILKPKSGRKKFVVEIFFTANSTKLGSVHLYQKKKKKGYGQAKLIGVDRPSPPVVAPVPANITQAAIPGGIISRAAYWAAVMPV